MFHAIFVARNIGPKKINKAIVAGTVGGGAVAVVVGAVVAFSLYAKRKDNGSGLGDETSPLQQGNGQHENVRRGNMSPGESETAAQQGNEQHVIVPRAEVSTGEASAAQVHQGEEGMRSFS